MKLTIKASTLLSLCFCLAAAPAVWAKDQKSGKASSYALLTGSCFNEKGFSLPGVSVSVKIKPEIGQKPSKQQWTAVSDMRGEFAIRLPAGANTFVVKAQKTGFTSQEKEATFASDERQELVFQLEPLAPKQ